MRIFLLEHDLTKIALMMEALGGDEGPHDITVARNLLEAFPLFDPPYDVAFLAHEFTPMPVSPLDVETGTNFVAKCCPTEDMSAINARTFQYVWVTAPHGDGAAAMCALLTDRAYPTIHAPFSLSLLRAMESL